MSIKPHFFAYLYSRVGALLLTLIVLILTLLLGDGDLLIRASEDVDNTNVLQWTGIALFGSIAIIGGLGLWYFRQSWRKERVTIGEKKFLYQKGNPFHTSETEVQVQKITKIQCDLPFIEYNVFGTGTIYLKAAGSKDDEIVFRNIKEPYQQYQSILEKLQDSGFRLDEDNLIKQESPQALGVLWDSVKRIASHITTHFMPLIIGSGGLLSFTNISLGVILFLISLITVVIITFLILDFYQHLRSSFQLYPHQVTYREYFLNQVYTIIPLSNVANTDISQDLVKRILGLSSVKISCQGIENHVFLPNIARAEAFKEAINHQLIHIGTSPSQRQEDSDSSSQQTSASAKSSSPDQNVATSTIPSEQDIYSQTKPNLKRSIVASLLFLGGGGLLGLILAGVSTLGIGDPGSVFIAVVLLVLIILGGFISLITSYIDSRIETYTITSNKIQKRVSFINKNSFEFSADKVTGITIKRNPLDWFLNTMTIYVQSIGTGTGITFRHIDKASGIEQALYQQQGFIPEEVQKTYRPDFTFENWMKAHLFAWIGGHSVAVLTLILGLFLFIYSPFFLILPAVYVIVVCILYLILQKKYSRVDLEQYENYLIFHDGLIFQKTYLSHFSDVKDLVSLQYPATSTGALTVNIAGSITQRVDDGSGNSNLMFHRPYQFTCPYLSSVSDIHNDIDTILYNHTFLDAYRYQMSLPDNAFTTEDTFQPNRRIILIRDSFIFVGIVLLSGGIAWLFFDSGSVLGGVLSIIGALVVMVAIYQLQALVYRRIYNYVQVLRIVQRSGIFYIRRISILYNRVDHIGTQQGLLQQWGSVGKVLLFTTGSALSDLTLEDLRDYQDVYQTLDKKISQ